MENINRKIKFMTNVRDVIINAGKHKILSKYVYDNYENMARAIFEKKLPYYIIVSDEDWIKIYNEFKKYNAYMYSLLLTVGNNEKRLIAIMANEKTLQANYGFKKEEKNGEKTD